MFEAFGFDPSSMSDDELLAKTTDLHAKLVYASRFSSVSMIDNLQRLIQVVERERNERVLRTIAREREQFSPDVIESDPDLAMAGRVEKPVERQKIIPQKRPHSIQISKKPTPDV